MDTKSYPKELDIMVREFRSDLNNIERRLAASRYIKNQGVIDFASDFLEVWDDHYAPPGRAMNEMHEEHKAFFEWLLQYFSQKYDGFTQSILAKDISGMIYVIEKEKNSDVRKAEYDMILCADADVLRKICQLNDEG